MSDIKAIIEELSIDALESNTKIAAVAVISDSGTIIHQSENFDLMNQGDIILNVFKGDTSFELNNFNYTVIESSSEAIIAKSDSGMGYIIITKFQGGLLVVYAMPGADPELVLSFLKKYSPKLDNEL
ncbi:MAG: hypothetical protein EU547_06160 [Promethearchaeota archaeon]|nr:MAG: hypothetical protein EU547_06160 [Candidatus Lokiarchaeota archaeon]